MVAAGCGGSPKPEPPAADADRRAGARARAGDRRRAGADRRRAGARAGGSATSIPTGWRMPACRFATVALSVLGTAIDAPAIRVGNEVSAITDGPPPQTSAITPAAVSAAQSCLGDTLAQTLLGPGTMGDDAALGVGLAESGDAPAGVQVRICAAPHYIRHVHAAEKAFAKRFGELGAPRRSGASGRSASARSASRPSRPRRCRAPRCWSCSRAARRCMRSPGAEFTDLQHRMGPRSRECRAFSSHERWSSP